MVDDKLYIRSKVADTTYGSLNKWTPLRVHSNFMEVYNFRDYNYKINDTVYSEDIPEFQKAMYYLIFWSYLSDRDD